MTNYVRQQVLLEPWQVAHLRSLKTPELSYSAVLRTVLNAYFIENGPMKLPPKINEREESYMARRALEKRKKQ